MKALQQKDKNVMRVHKALVPVVRALGCEFYGPYITRQGTKIDLITPHLFDQLPDKARLIDFDGNSVAKTAVASRDTRLGYMAYGLPSRHRGMRTYIGKRRYK